MIENPLSWLIKKVFGSGNPVNTTPTPPVETGANSPAKEDGVVTGVLRKPGLESRSPDKIVSDEKRRSGTGPLSQIQVGEKASVILQVPVGVALHNETHDVVRADLPNPVAPVPSSANTNEGTS